MDPVRPASGCDRIGLRPSSIVIADSSHCDQIIVQIQNRIWSKKGISKTKTKCKKQQTNGLVSVNAKCPQPLVMISMWNNKAKRFVEYLNILSIDIL